MRATHSDKQSNINVYKYIHMCLWYIQIMYIFMCDGFLSTLSPCRTITNASRGGLPGSDNHVESPDTLLGTNISHFKGTFEDDFPIPQVGYVNSLVGIM